MGNGFDHQSIHKHHQKTIFLPLFCRLSIKDIKLNYHRKSPISTDDDEPSSPKQNPFAPATTQGGTVSGGGRSGSKSCTSSREVTLSQKNSRRLKLKNDGDQDCVKLVNVRELDPPLPVVKRAAASGVDRDEMNLWKRRSNGAALKSLQIEQIHLRNSSSQPPTV
ncbi:UNVERIFIED_CONTAM: hypothetical protein Sangu_1956300 [Sesamum angustifolium]|uniref:Uncharacterized protein n=1 Tax=Sesamum angustifolium TaxID=2727405 RepID=A0AAW2LW29_9LAMI